MLHCDALDLTREEQNHVRAAIHFLKTRVGGWKTLAKVLHVEPRFLADHATPKGRTITPTLAFRIARFAKVPMEDVLSGTFPAGLGRREPLLLTMIKLGNPRQVVCSSAP